MNHTTPDFDALIDPARLPGPDAATQSISVPVAMEPDAPRPVRAGTAPSMPRNWSLPAMSERSRPAYSRTEPETTPAVGPAVGSAQALSANATALPRRRIVRAAQGAPRGRRSSAAPRSVRPAMRGMLLTSAGVTAATAALIAGAVAAQSRPAEVPTATELTIEGSPRINDALPRERPLTSPDPSPLLPDSEPDAEPEPSEPTNP